MALTPVYLISAKNLGKFLESLRHAQAPEKFSLRFLEELGFKSTNDRLFVPLLKALKFLDDSGKPTARYHAFLDDSQWQRVLADGVKDAFLDLFRVNKDAQKLSREALSGKLKSLGEGKLSPAVLLNTTKTFLELAKLADFSAEASEAVDGEPTPAAEATSTLTMATKPQRTSSDSSQPIALIYRIEIVLPAVRDQAIYDAIFKSAKEHLLK